MNSRMKKIAYLVLFTLTGCFTKGKNEVVVYMENNSDVDAVINIKTLINGRLYKVTPVKRQSTADILVPLVVKFPDNMDSIKLTFINSNRGDSASCVVHRELVGPKTWVHVCFNELIFKKGFKLYDKVLNRDSLMDYKFYAEIINR